MNEINLKKCPFCGGEAKLNVSKDGVRVRCTECHNQSVQLIDDDTYTAVYAVIAFWNRRTEK